MHFLSHVDPKARVIDSSENPRAALFKAADPQVLSMTVGHGGPWTMKKEWCAGMGAGQNKKSVHEIARDQGFQQNGG